MNVIYITESKISPTAGGIARITHSLAKAMSQLYGFSCYSLYTYEDENSQDVTNGFQACYQFFNKEQLRTILLNLGSGVIVIQSPCSTEKLVFEAINLLHQFKVIRVFHGEPGFETIRLDWGVIGYRLRHHIDVKWLIKQCAIQLSSYLLGEKGVRKLLSKKYSLPYGKVNKIVLLASRNIPLYQQIAPYSDDIFCTIPNALSFPYEPTQTYQKLHEVVLVSRLDDWHKCIKKALQIWAIVQRNSKLQNWTLRIIGSGQDECYYKDYVAKNHIPHIVFEGKQDPRTYYQNANLFMMTSISEGFSLTLLEASQYGCIPIAFDNFASARDIICDGKNGYLIPKNNKQAYAEKMQLLMQDESLQKSMRKQCVDMCERYTIENIAQQWNQLINQIC